MMRKGISPLVAAVLLIAVTMTIAGLMTYWATSFVRTSLPATNETEAQCRFADFAVYSCLYTNSTKKLNLILENLRAVELRELKLYIIYANDTVSPEIELNETLLAGTIKSYTISDVDAFSKILVKTHCPELSKESVCSRK